MKNIYQKKDYITIKKQNMNKIAIEALLLKRNDLITKRDADFYLSTQEIKGIELAIEQLSGKNVWEVEEEAKYDDENPNYIKSSIED